MQVSTLGQHLDNLSHRYIKPMQYQRLATGMVRRGTKPIHRLPQNAYDDSWFQALQQNEQVALRAEDTRYDFTLDYA